VTTFVSSRKLKADGRKRTLHSHRHRLIFGVFVELRKKVGTTQPEYYRIAIYFNILNDYSRLGPNLFHGGKCQISRRFWQKMPDFTEISLKVICCSLKPQNHLPALIDT